MRDSKLLTKRKRAFLFDEIKSIAEEVKTYKITNDEINIAMRSGVSLNQLEAMHFARLIDDVEADIDRAYIDSPDVIAERFGMRISLFAKKPTKAFGSQGRGWEEKRIKIISEHKADIRYPVVSGRQHNSQGHKGRRDGEDREEGRHRHRLGLSGGQGAPSTP